MPRMAEMTDALSGWTAPPPLARASGAGLIRYFETAEAAIEFIARTHSASPVAARSAVSPRRLPAYPRSENRIRQNV